MSQENDLQSRRRFLKVAAGTAAAAAVVGSLPRFARAADLPHVAESDPTAKALDYVEDASQSKNPKHKAGDVCANCQFYSGTGTAGYGPCQLFPGKSVNAKGWCVSHTPKKA
ncbi:MAG TPA: high-potential iron-sulfur protein [Frateuria sp.]|uniref:high-potential iron-sulfur protein n=1 Tax=Frateuria sp. TaxID=2211372 RepID=UPI002DE21525|nr:high-potential iron-sulfur protein [Frateuria sp.]